ncbi:MAG: 2Fe-2S iron-sulfur cluster binding domain-containing protein [Kineosporiaceae bacterium]|nr:2Fe-2S iron-sulfur cluster binding domain-containing protein [Aeromicrobium sp.]
MGIIRKALNSKAVATMATPHTVDHFLDQLHPMLAVNNVRARVVEVIHETGVASTVVLRPNGTWTGFKPGQHVQFGVEVEGKRRIRCFSVSSSTQRQDGLFSVSVKAHPDGYVSQYLHRELQPKTLVYLSQAEGEFVLPDDVPDNLLLMSGGSGITPVMSMVRTLVDTGHQGNVTFLHYARSRTDEMFSDELDAIESHPNVRMVRVYTREPAPGADLKGRFDIEHLKQLGIDLGSTLTYICGPAGLIQTVKDTYDEVGALDQLRLEFFKIPSVNLDAADATGTLTFDDSTLEVPNDGRTILEQAEAAGLKPAYGCRMGVCNTCAIKKKHGAVRHVISGEVQANTDEVIKICVSTPVGDACVAL